MTYRLRCSTDHIDEEATRSRLVSFLRLFFPTAIFLVSFANDPLWLGGYVSTSALGRGRPAGNGAGV